MGTKRDLSRLLRMLTTWESRFWKNTLKSDGCWTWIGPSSGNFGYGMFCADGQRNYAHRVSWALHNGEIEGGLSVLHRCDNPRCVNPAHLFLGTQSDNNKDMFRKGRARPRGDGLWGDNNPASKLTTNLAWFARELYSMGSFSQQNLGDMLGVSSKAIGYLVRRKTWTK